MQWDFSFLLEQRDFILKGFFGTLRLAAISLVFGMILGLLAAALRLSPFRALQFIGAAFVELFRNIPVLVQMFWFYFTVPIITGWQPDALAAAATALSLYGGAYFGEIFRSGIQSIERPQWDGARAIGFGYRMTMRHVILPQAFRRILPAFTNEVMEVIKSTSVASTIAYGEILYSAKVLSDQEFRPIETYTAVGAFFIGSLLLIALGSSLLERRLRVTMGA